MGSTRSNSPSANTVLSDLDQSLIAYSQKPNSPSDSFLAIFPPENNPRFFSGGGDNAQYWVGLEGEVLTLAFPALFHATGKFVKMSPYFNMHNANGVRTFFIFLFFLLNSLASCS
jgi:hypothetical protein